jgi:tRNA 2-thiouridine synthesizing protein A
MPVIRVQSAVESLSDGIQVEAVCTDPGALNDIPAWCRVNGHKLIETRSEDNEFIVVVEVDHGSN